MSKIVRFKEALYGAIVHHYSDAETKDVILKSVELVTQHTKEIASQIGQPEPLVAYLVEEFRDRGLVILRSTASRYTGVTNEYFVTITNKGTYFLNFDGGHKRLARQMMLNKAWMIAKTIAVISNALIIIYLTYLSITRPQ